jgi:hypothetical protein
VTTSGLPRGGCGEPPDRSTVADQLSGIPQQAIDNSKAPARDRNLWSAGQLGQKPAGCEQNQGFSDTTTTKINPYLSKGCAPDPRLGKTPRRETCRIRGCLPPTARRGDLNRSSCGRRNCRPSNETSLSPTIDRPICVGFAVGERAGVRGLRNDVRCCPLTPDPSPPFTRYGDRRCCGGEGGT